MPRQKSRLESTELPGVLRLVRHDGTYLAMIDAEDAATVEQFTWRTSNYEYVARHYMREKGKQTAEMLQRHVALNMGLDIANATVKFRDGDSRNCRRSNLVVVPKKITKLPSQPSANDNGSTDAPADKQLELPFSAE